MDEWKIVIVFSVGWMYWICSDLDCKLFSIVSLALVNVFIFLNIQAVTKWISFLVCFERPFYEQVPKFSFCLLRIAIYFSSISLLHCFLCYYNGPMKYENVLVFQFLLIVSSVSTGLTTIFFYHFLWIFCSVAVSLALTWLLGLWLADSKCTVTGKS